MANTGCVLKVELKGFVNQLDVLCDREEKKKNPPGFVIRNKGFSSLEKEVMMEVSLRRRFS